MFDDGRHSWIIGAAYVCVFGVKFLIGCQIGCHVWGFLCDRLNAVSSQAA